MLNPPEAGATLRAGWDVTFGGMPPRSRVWVSHGDSVERMPDGHVRAQGKVWPRDQQEPQAWTIQRIDPIGNAKGAPGLYADVPPAAEIFFDNISVYPNQS